MFMKQILHQLGSLLCLVDLSLNSSVCPHHMQNIQQQRRWSSPQIKPET